MPHYKELKSVTISVTYSRTCLVVADDFENLEEAVRSQIKMPNNPSVDISDWSEDEFCVLENKEFNQKITIPNVRDKEIPKTDSSA